MSKIEKPEEARTNLLIGGPNAGKTFKFTGTGDVIGQKGGFYARTTDSDDFGRTKWVWTAPILP
jgi:hypothetical protein